MSLLDLPGELLDEIIHLTLPHGLEGFVLSCKTIYERAGAQIAHHNWLKSKSKYAATPSNDQYKAIHLLHAISRDSLLTQYIDALRLSLTTERSQGVTALDHPKLEEGDMEKIETTVTESRFLQEAGVDVEAWWESVMEEDERDPRDAEDAGLLNHPWYTTISLLGQLSELKLLQPPEWWPVIFANLEEDSPHCALLKYGLDSLMRYSNNRAGQERPLGKLRIILPFLTSGREEWAQMQCVSPFLDLQSIRELCFISCVAVEDDYAAMPFNWLAGTLTSPLRKLELAYCAIDEHEIAKVLSHTPQLEVFRYSHETKGEFGFDWNPGAFVDAIARNCSSTIKDLAITIDQLDGDVINGCSSFLNFTQLEALEVDVGIFCGPPIESGQKGGTHSVVPDNERAWTVEDIPCIGSMLSPSIVNVNINTDFPDLNATCNLDNPYNDKVSLKSLLKDIREQKSTRLHRLKNVTLRQHHGDSAIGTFGIPGLVVVLDGSSADELPRDMLPAWKREFSMRVGGIPRYHDSDDD